MSFVSSVQDTKSTVELNQMAYEIDGLSRLNPIPFSKPLKVPEISERRIGLPCILCGVVGCNTAAHAGVEWQMVQMSLVHCFPSLPCFSFSEL